MTLKKLTALVMTAACLMNVAHAAKMGAYMGGGLGSSSLGDFSDASTDGDVGLGANLFIGYNLTPYLGIEGSYKYYDQTAYTLDDTNLSFNYNMQTYSLVGKFYMPMADERWNFYAALGAADVVSSINIDVENPYSGYTYRVGTLTNNTILPTAAVGITHDISAYLTGSIDMSVIGGKDGSSTTIAIPTAIMTTLNLAYTFN